MRLILSALIVLTVATACSTASRKVASQASPREAIFLRWATSEAKPIRTVEISPDDSDLAAFGTMVGDAKIVGFGESAHGVYEQTQVRVRFLKYLVEQKGFSAIVMESGILEGHVVEKYIHGDPTLSIEEVLARGFTHTMGKYEETKALVEWMRQHNDRQGSSRTKVHFYGMDLPLNGDSAIAPLSQLSGYFKKVDSAYHSAEFEPLLDLARKANQVTDKVEASQKAKGREGIDGDFLDAVTTISFEMMSGEEQAALDVGIWRLGEHLRKKKSVYVASSSRDEFEWNSRLAAVARQILRDLRFRQNSYTKIAHYGTVAKILGIQPDPKHLMIEDVSSPAFSREDFKNYLRSRDTRERALAENVQWAQQRHGKILLVGHNGHLIRPASFETSIGSVNLGETGDSAAGHFIAEWYGPNYFIIGSTLDAYIDPSSGKLLGEVHGVPVTATSDCDECFEKPLSEIGKTHAMYLLDFRSQGAPLAWIDQKRECRFDIGGFQRYNPRAAMDAIFFVSRAKPAFKLR